MLHSTCITPISLTGEKVFLLHYIQRSNFTLLCHRAVSFASLRLPTPEQPAYFVPPGVINRLNFSVHRDEESHHRSKRPSISSLAGDLFAYSRDALVVYVMNWREARVIILDAEQTGVRLTLPHSFMLISHLISLCP